MAFKVNKADGKAVVIQDYTKEIIGGLNLLGYGFANYSDEIAQNFVKDLENNAGITEPVNPVLGQFWFHIPANPTTENKMLKICTSTSATTLDGRWKILMSITPSNDVQVDAWTLRGKAPVTPGGGSTGVGQPVVLDTNGKVNAAYLPAASAQTNVDTANRLARTSTFGSRNGGLQYNGTQDVGLTTTHIAEGDQQYFTTARVRAAISSDGAISYNPTTGVISYTPPPSSAAVNSFNGRSGAVTLTGTDVTNALGYVPTNLGYTPVNKAGDRMDNVLQFMDDQYYAVLSGGNPILNFSANNYLYHRRSTGHMIFAMEGGERLRIGNGDSDFYHNGHVIWHGGHQGSGTGMDADTVDGKHASDFMTSGSFTNLVGDNGYQILPNGLVIQWGRHRELIRSEQVRTVTLPIAVGVIYVGQATAYTNQWSQYLDLWMVRQGNGTNTSVTFGFQSSTSNDQRSDGFDWIVIGRI